MTALAWRLSDLVRGEGNPNHDPKDGRFTSGGSSNFEDKLLDATSGKPAPPSTSRLVADRTYCAQCETHRPSVEAYVGAEYVSINSTLRGSSIGNTPEYITQERVAGLDAAIASTTPLDKPLTVYRGVNVTKLGYANGESVVLGDTMTDNGFTSTTTEEGYARHWGGSAKEGTRVELRIEVPAGEHVLNIGKAFPELHWEDEVLLPRGGRYEITERLPDVSTRVITGIDPGGADFKIPVYAVKYHPPTPVKRSTLAWHRTSITITKPPCGCGKNRSNPNHDPATGQFASGGTAAISLDKDYVRPVVHQVTDIDEAVRRILKGDVVELPDTRSVNTVLVRLAAVAEDAKAKGEQAPSYDLCNVSVPKTNLFCGSKVVTPEFPHGIPRLQMPQLEGIPRAGSDAEQLPPSKRGKVNGGEAFVDMLRTMGIDVKDGVVPAAKLKASQSELVGAKVAEMMVAPPYEEPIFISRDHYVVDGHHRWASIVGRDAADGHLGDLTMSVRQIDAPISEVLKIAKAWADKVGIQQREREWTGARSNFVEDEHPRAPSGSSAGGQFTGGGGEFSGGSAYCPLCGTHRLAIHQYMGFDYTKINGQLRGTWKAVHGTTTSQVNERIHAIDAAIASTPPIDVPITVYRGITPEHLGFTNTDLTGTITDLGFTSTTHSSHQALAFGTVVLKIDVPKGARVLDLPKADIDYDSQAEEEVILPRGGSYEIMQRLGSFDADNPDVPVYAVKYHPLKAVRSNPNHDPATGQFASSGQFAIEPGKIPGINPPTEKGSAYCPACKTQYNALGAYVGADGGRAYRVINEFLRGGTTNPMSDPSDRTYQGQQLTDTHLAQIVHGVDQAIASTPVLTEALSVYRGVNLNGFGFDNATPVIGTVIDDSGFVSASHSADEADFFARGKPALFRITVPKGSQVLDLRKAGMYDHAVGNVAVDEQVIFPRGGSYEIIGKSESLGVGMRTLPVWNVLYHPPRQSTTRGNPYHLPGGTPEGGRFTGPTIDHGADSAVAANVLTSPGRTLGGSNGARVWKGADGVSRIVKLYGEPGQGQGESLANDLYRRLGIPAPESFTFEHDGDTYYAAPMIPGVSAQRELGNLGLTKERATTVLNGFGADVLTANWDTAGLTLDNVVETPDGKIVRVDNGAAFLFRAMGERKPEPMLTAVTEWESFAPGGRNRSYAKIFEAAGIDKADDIPGMSHQIDRIVALRDEVGGWKRYVTAKTPNMRADDRAKIIQMLDARTEFLIQKRAMLVARSIVRDNQHHRPAGSPGGTGGQFTSAEGAGGVESLDTVINKMLEARLDVDAKNTVKQNAWATYLASQHTDENKNAYEHAANEYDAAFAVLGKAEKAYNEHPENPLAKAGKSLAELKAKFGDAQIAFNDAAKDYQAAYTKQYGASPETYDAAVKAFDEAKVTWKAAQNELNVAQREYEAHPEHPDKLAAAAYEKYKNVPLDIAYARVLDAKATIDATMGKPAESAKAIDAWEKAKQAYQENPENPNGIHPDNHIILLAAKQPLETVKTNIQAAAVEYNNASEAKDAALREFSKAGGNTDENKAAVDKAAKALWAADNKVRNLEEAYRDHPENPQHYGSVNHQIVMAINEGAKQPIDVVKAQRDVAEKEYQKANNESSTLSWNPDSSIGEKDIAEEKANDAYGKYNALKQAYEAHPDNPKNQPFETVVAARDAALKEYQDKLNAMSPDSGATYEKYSELKTIAGNHPGNPANMSYDDLVELKGKLDEAHNMAADATKALRDSGATSDEIHAAEGKEQEAYSKWSKVDDLVNDHPDNPDNTPKDEYGNDVELDDNGDPIKKDEYGHPIAYDDNGDPIETDRYGDPVSKVDTSYCEACGDSEETLTYYTGSGHGRINESLRNPKNAHPGSIDSKVSEVDAAIASTEPLPESTMVWRGANTLRLGYDDPTKLSGESFTDLGFTSTSISQDTASKFGGNSGREHLAMFKIVLPKGMQALDVDRSGIKNDNEGEQEMLLPRGGSFEIGKMTMTKAFSWDNKKYPQYDVIYHPPEEKWVPPHRDQLALELKSDSRLSWQLVRWNTNPHDPSNGRFTGSGGGTAADREWSSWNDVSVWEEHTPQHVDVAYCPDCAPNYGAIVEYVQDGHRPINNLLRTGATGKSPMGDWKTPDEYQRYISGLDAAIASTPETTSEQVLYRGVNIAKFNPDDLKIGNTFEDKGFASTSSDQGVALRGFSHVVGSKDKTGTLLRITVPKGSRVLDIGRATPRASDISDDEAEVLLPRDGRYTVTAMKVSEAALASFKYRVFDLTYEPPKVSLANLDTRGNPYPHVPGGSSAGGQFTGPGAGGAAFPVGATSNIINPPPESPHYKDPDEERLAAAKQYCPGCQGYKGDVMALDQYTGIGYIDINKLARGHPATQDWTPAEKEQAIEHIASMDRLIASTPPTEAPLIVYRGVNAERLGFTSLDEMAGETVEDPGFSSTSKDPVRGADFAYMRGHQMVVLKMEIPKGAQALDVERAARGDIEQEVILPRGGRFEFIERLPDTLTPKWAAYDNKPDVRIPVFAVRYHPPGAK